VLLNVTHSIRLHVQLSFGKLENAPQTQRGFVFAAAALHFTLLINLFQHLHTASTPITQDFHIIRKNKNNSISHSETSL